MIKFIISGQTIVKKNNRTFNRKTGMPFKSKRLKEYEDMATKKLEICKIIKAKNWINPMLKPTGKQRKYALYQGCKFYPKSEWEMEE